MNEVEAAVGRSLEGLSDAEWRRAIVDVAEEHGFYQPLGERHFAALVEHGSTLLVTFERLADMRQEGAPLGWQVLRDMGWSHLCLGCEGDTWFRAAPVYGFFDRLDDDGFFEDFDQVVFYGAGACGYAAAALSVAAPGATVLTVAPQATLDPAETLWDHRFPQMRRTSFRDRYGYAPDMIEAAQHAFVIHDPAESFDAMHAALFRRSNVTRLAMRRMGPAIEGDLREMDILTELIALAGNGRLDRRAFAQLARARREHPPYLRRLLALLEARERPILAAMLCRNVVSRMKAPRFARRLDALEKAALDARVRAAEEREEAQAG